MSFSPTVNRRSPACCPYIPNIASTSSGGPTALQGCRPPPHPSLSRMRRQHRLEASMCLKVRSGDPRGPREELSQNAELEDFTKISFFAPTGWCNDQRWWFFPVRPPQKSHVGYNTITKQGLCGLLMCIYLHILLFDTNNKELCREHRDRNSLKLTLMQPIVSPFGILEFGLFYIMYV